MGQAGEVKLDFLTGAPNAEVPIDAIRVDPRRWRPRSTKAKLHAHPAPEALGLEEHPHQVQIQGRRSSGEPYEASVYLPQAFSYALMKLHAFRDRCNQPAKAYARHHELDLYSIIAMATEEEWSNALDLHERYAGDLHVEEATRIVEVYSRDQTSPGILRLKEHPEYHQDLAVPDFLAALHELFL